MCLQAIYTAKSLAEACCDLAYQVDKQFTVKAFPHREALVNHLTPGRTVFCTPIACPPPPLLPGQIIAKPSHLTATSSCIGGLIQQLQSCMRACALADAVLASMYGYLK